MKSKQDLINELTDKLAHYKKLQCDLQSDWYHNKMSEHWYTLKMSEYEGAINALDGLCPTIYQLQE